MPRSPIKVGQVQSVNFGYQDIPLVYKIRFYCVIFFQIILYRLPLIARILRFIGYRLVVLGSWEKIEAHRRKMISFLKQNKESAQDMGSGYGYQDEVQELAVVAEYHKQILGKDFHKIQSESAILYENIVNDVSKVLDNNRDIKKFVNFGVCYAHIDSILAQKYKGVNFYGIDRSLFTKIYNEKHFGDVKNMHFIAGDIFDFLGGQKFNDAIFFHARTLTVLTEAFVRKLYKIVHAAQFKYIVGMEQSGISYETLKPYMFSENYKPSVFFRSNANIHNYPYFLVESGYKIIEIDLVKTNHPDCQIIKFIAQKIS